MAAIDRYQQSADTRPATYPHVLAFPLAVDLMTGASFPFGVLGLVHLANRIERLRPVDAGERLNLRVWAADLAPHDRGRQFDVLAEAVAGGELVWREHSTYLHRERGGGGGGRNRSEPPVAGAIWTLPGDIGPRYAAVSGDRNPSTCTR